MEEIGFSIPCSKVVGDLNHRRVRFVKKGSVWVILVAIAEDPVRQIFRRYKHSDPAIAERAVTELGFTKTELEVITNTWSRGEFKHWCDQVIGWLTKNPDKLTPNFDAYLTIQDWRKKERTGGKLWCMDHPSGPGYYTEAVLDKLYSNKFADNE